MLAFVILIIVVALVFDYSNGMHDAANSIATVVSTRVLTPMQAVAMAAVFNALAVVVGTHVASAIGTGFVRKEAVNETVVFAALLGAIVWNLLTWWLGLPSSSSHALVGGLLGAGFASGGTAALVLDSTSKVPVTLEWIVLSPLIGLILAFLLMIAVFWTFRYLSPASVDRLFRRLQLLSAAAYSFGHGSNDAQKTMGIIGMVLYHYTLSGDPHATFEIPLWVRLACCCMMGLGTLSGGWRIVKTMGSKICKLRPAGGVCAETAGALTLMSTAFWGIPVSTTHTITGAIIGVGSTQRLSAVRWGVAKNVVVAWVLTIPAAALVGYVACILLTPLTRLLGVI